MSGFDDNPFDDSPFQDPAIKQATGQQKAAGDGFLEDYNPFEDAPQNARPTTVDINKSDSMVRGAANPPNYGGFGESSVSPAVMSPVSQEMPPPYKTPQSTGPPPQISTEELHRRQEELERKTRELERREEEIRNTPFNARKNNWPPLPQSFPVQPCFYQDINVDIPVEFQRIVRWLYYLWALHTFVLLFNIIMMILRVIFIHTKDDFLGLGLSIIYVFIFSPTAYLCWFRPAYKAFRNDSSFNFMVFFFVFFFQFIMSIVLAIFMSGACGIVDGIGMLTDGGVAKVIIGILVLLTGISFACLAALDFYMLVKVHGIYKNSGASFAKAQAEFASGVMRNEHVQGAAQNMASEALRAQMNNATSPRY